MGAWIGGDTWQPDQDVRTVPYPSLEPVASDVFRDVLAAQAQAWEAVEAEGAVVPDRRLRPPAPSESQGAPLPAMPVFDQPAGSGVTGPEAAFRQGYRDYGGREEWLNHFVEDVLPCESSYWGGWYPNGYVSRAQFHVLSWATTVRNTNRDRPDDPYTVGANVAWWSNAVDPGGTGGWPACFWVNWP